MATPAITALVQELDSYTPCVVLQGNFEQKKNYERLTFLVEIIIDTARCHFTKRQVEKIHECLRYSAKNHKGIYRQDGFIPYLLHPLEVAFILIGLEIYDYKILMAAILHDVAEDGEKGIEEHLKEIATLFGIGISRIVRLMTKNPIAQKTQYHEFLERHMALMKKWYDPWGLITVAKNPTYWQLMKEEPDLNCRWRVIALKIADRKHNFMTMGAMSAKQRDKKVKETQREFPELYEVLVKTIRHLYLRKTIKKVQYLAIPHKLKNQLDYWLKQHS